MEEYQKLYIHGKTERRNSRGRLRAMWDYNVQQAMRKFGVTDQNTEVQRAMEKFN